MPMFSLDDQAQLLAVFTDAQTDTSLTLYRYNEGSGAYDAIPAQGVQVAYAARQTQFGGVQNVEASLAGLTFYREAPFDVRVGDTFSLDGHKGGTIRRVYTDPVLGVIAAEADLDIGTA